MTAAVGAAAAAAARILQHEEEEMTNYRREDMDGWEFKILRSATNAFKDPEKLNLAVAEEAVFGWELLEKFDNGRLRFKRSTNARKMPAPTGSDPYRTEFGMSEGRIAAYVVLGIIAFFAIVGIVVTVFVN
ncbi:MAG: hypothetical protein KIS88_09055 [Anaerolineales bacterium]|nr:hypothetical protein [Anaerolineales bacterium]